MSMIDRAVAMRTQTIVSLFARTVRRDMEDALLALEGGNEVRARHLLNQALTCFDNMSDAWQADELKREPAA